MKDKDFEILLNPVRFRVLQYLELHKEATVASMSNFLKDVPQASLYRHINKLAKAGAIRVIQENQIRGTVEKVYALTPDLWRNEDSNPQIYNKVRLVLLSLMADFAGYMEDESNDPKADMLLLNSYMFAATEQEYEGMMRDIALCFQPLLDKPVGEGRRLRKFTLISSPVEQEPRTQSNNKTGGENEKNID